MYPDAELSLDEGQGLLHDTLTEFFEFDTSAAPISAKESESRRSTSAQDTRNFARSLVLIDETTRRLSLSEVDSGSSIDEVESSRLPYRASPGLDPSHIRISALS